jgi:dTMP kinase
MSGVFITIEGIEGVGKSTAIKTAVDFLERHGLPVTRAREPGGTEIAEAIRQLLLSHYSEPMIPLTELLLMFAARAQHIEHVIKPALAAGQWVVCDRFSDASFAYQGGGRGLAMGTIANLAEWVQGDLTPTLTLLLDAPVEMALARIQARGKTDRIEQEAVSFFERVREAYLELARSHPERIKLVDASVPEAVVATQIEAILARYL